MDTKPSDDPGLNEAMRKLTRHTSSDTRILLLLSHSLLDGVASAKPLWINTESDILPVSIKLHIRHAELSEKNGRFSEAAREFWHAGDNANVVRIYWKWVEADRKKGNLLDAAKLELQLKRGEHPLSAPIFRDALPSSVKRDHIFSAKRQG